MRAAEALEGACPNRELPLYKVCSEHEEAMIVLIPAQVQVGKYNV
jgi:hypothetical protein